MPGIRLLVVDDHRIFAESLAAALSAEKGAEASVAGSAPAAVRSLARAAAEGRGFDVLLVDAHLPPALDDAGMPAAEAQAAPAVSEENDSAGGTALLSRARADHPGLRAVVLADRDDPVQAAAALRAGANGWVAKDCSLSSLLQIIRGVLRDETHVPAALLTGVVRVLTADRRHRAESDRLLDALTPREHEVLRCMIAGLGRRAVAERLGLSPHTVRTHMQNVLGKLEVHSTLAAVALARRAGMGPAPASPGPSGAERSAAGGQQTESPPE
ncbi:helix-turn-helix transcriptional regulator [Streptomyces oceani]|uniref:Transcriptional regulator n=1 Tax=Streptomyces oceani TaxID=1075402 RepID=A0A1E7KN35_9ACTN|nr:response regulator transcription factor [Streptomyces oceani]OEV05306.1 transcriptional regulator [Streptomyces oceani]